MARLKSEAGFTLTELLIVAAILGFTMAAVLGIYQVTQRTTFFATAGEDAQLQGRAVLDRLVADFQLINSGRTTASGAITAVTASSITFVADIDNTLDSNGNPIAVAGVTSPDCPTSDPCAPAGATSVKVNAPGVPLADRFPCGSPLSLSDGPIAETHPLKSTGCIDTATDTLNLATGETLSTWYPSGGFIRSVETVSYVLGPALDTLTPPSRNLCRILGALTATPPCPDPTAPSPPNPTDPNDQVIATGVTNFQLTYRDSAGTATATLDSIRQIDVTISVRSQSGDQTVTRTMQVTVRPRNFF